jgi:mono/diheme cytochrome c family protein
MAVAFRASIPAFRTSTRDGLARIRALKGGFMGRVASVALAFIVGFPAIVAGQDAAAGQKVYEAQKCSLCHSVAGKGNAKGPLEGVGKKYTAADLKLWITQPAEMTKKHNATRKPPMKSFASLPAADVDALVAYLQSLK